MALLSVVNSRRRKRRNVLHTNDVDLVRNAGMYMYVQYKARKTHRQILEVRTDLLRIGSVKGNLLM